MSPQLGQQLFESFHGLRKLPWLSFQNRGTKASGMHVLFCLDHGAREMSVDPDAGMMVSEIGQRLKVTSPTVTQMVKELVATGHVERTVDAHDRRVIRVLLTELGHETVQEGRMAVRKVFAGLVDHLGEEDSHTLIRLLQKVLSFQGTIAVPERSRTLAEPVADAEIGVTTGTTRVTPTHLDGGERL